MRACVLSFLILLACSLHPVAQTAPPQSAQKRSSEAKSPVTGTPAPNPSPVAMELKLVVGLFRHGVRAPLSEIDDPSKNKPHAKSPWPTKAEWGVYCWGELTPHGGDLVEALGRYYARTYKGKLPAGAKGFLWADVAQRTLKTAQGLAAGLNANNAIPTTVDFRRSVHPDPLFHPFEAHCGTPEADRILTISNWIGANSQWWIKSKFAAPFEELYQVLGCTEKDSANCQPLEKVADNNTYPCPSPTPRAAGPSPTPTPTPTATPACPSPPKGGCSAPFEWHGQFPYANTASETFLLQYANKMKVGWGQVWKPSEDETTLRRLMALHEFYFDQTQRNGYVSTIEASNLLREISVTLNDEKMDCRRIPSGIAFGALVGHDTNIASVASLLNLTWQFDDTAPEGTRGLPDNDPLPAGALLFELWKEGNASFVRIFYAAQGLREMRNFTKGGSCDPFRLPVRCDQYSVEPTSCKIPLEDFTKAVKSAIGTDFLSHCEINGNDQVCGPILGAAP